MVKSKRLTEWEKYKEIVFPVEITSNMRKTKWIIKCLDCSLAREISYSHAWNIIKNKNSGRCQSCAEKHKHEGSPKKVYVKKGRKHSFFKYLNLFNNPSKLPEIKEKMKKAKQGKTGELSNAWDGGKTEERIILTSRIEYKQLRLEVFKRDNFTCVVCNKTKVPLEMDHIKEWCNYPELRFEKSNLRTLCKECHRKTDNYGRRKRNASL